MASDRLVDGIADSDILRIRQTHGIVDAPIWENEGMSYGNHNKATVSVLLIQMGLACGSRRLVVLRRRITPADNAHHHVVAGLCSLGIA